jgi:hypothetical protein
MKSLAWSFLALGVLSGIYQGSSQADRARMHQIEAEESLHQVFLELPVSEMQWSDLLRELEEKESLDPAEQLLYHSLKRLSENLTAAKD